MDKRITLLTINMLLCITLVLTSCSGIREAKDGTSHAETASAHTNSDSSAAISDDELFEDKNNSFCIVNNNVPFFFDSELTTEPYQHYSELDRLGRCGTAAAVIGKETLPTEERGRIGNIKPSGWHTVKYNDIIEGNYLYNRCHLIGYQLSGENANERNLITGTRFLNVSGMLPFENRVTEYVSETGNHVLYRVTPKFDKDNLLADGVLIEAKSVEDSGAGLQFCVFCYNIQPGITIDYATGNSKVYDGTPIAATVEPESDRSSEDVSESSTEPTISDTPETSADTDTSQENAPTDTSPAETPDTVEDIPREYIVNNGTKKFHLPDCPSVDDIKEKNKYAYYGTQSELIENGYAPCQRCLS